jgi:hypothetical protein
MLTPVTMLIPPDPGSRNEMIRRAPFDVPRTAALTTGGTEVTMQGR